MNPAETPSLPAALEPSPGDQARSLPKVLLHEHLDGGLRESTLFELLLQRGLDPPAADVAALRQWFDDRAHAGSLVEYLRGFALTVAAMASPGALARVAREAAEDAQRDGCVLAEFRIAPLLFEPFGVAGDAAVEALLQGLSECPLPTGLIVCAMRDHGDHEIRRSAELAMRWRGRGVVAFDLAGPERGWPATAHADLLRRVCDSGLGLTLHAGEADDGWRVVEAARLGARRVGHGVHLVDLMARDDWPALEAELSQRRLHLEICPTSNVHTGAAASVAAHPIRQLWQAGVSLSFHTDNRLMSRTSPSGEAQALVDQAGFGWEALRSMGEQAARATFLGPSAQQAALEALTAWKPDPGKP